MHFFLQDYSGRRVGWNKKVQKGHKWKKKSEDETIEKEFQH